jgi:hypothetical protein
MTAHMRLDDRNFAVFCFSKVKGAETFREQLNGERLPGHGR